jgi:hypothetical protein
MTGGDAAAGVETNQTGRYAVPQPDESAVYEQMHLLMRAALRAVPFVLHVPYPCLLRRSIVEIIRQLLQRNVTDAQYRQLP